MMKTLKEAMNCNYIALFSKNYRIGYKKEDSYDAARDFLQSKSDARYCIPVAIIECEKKELVWFEKPLGRDECQSRVDEFINQNTKP